LLHTCEKSRRGEKCLQTRKEAGKMTRTRVGGRGKGTSAPLKEGSYYFNRSTEGKRAIFPAQRQRGGKSLYVEATPNPKTHPPPPRGRGNKQKRGVVPRISEKKGFFRGETSSASLKGNSVISFITMDKKGLVGEGKGRLLQGGERKEGAEP